MFFPSVRTPIRGSQRPRYRPLVESLEDRLTPAATFFFLNSGATLVINGDAANDNILITEQATAGAFAVSGGGLNNAFTGVSAIFVNLNGGTNQSVTYNGVAGGGLMGAFGVSDSSSTSCTVTIGNDANITGLMQVQENGAADFAVNLGQSGAGASAISNVEVYGGTGPNTVNADDITMGYLSANANAATALNVNIGANGGAVTMGFLSAVNTSSAAGSTVVANIGAAATVTIVGNTAIFAGLGAGLTMNSVSAQGYITFNAPAATAAATVSLTNVGTVSFVSIVTGTGNDTINIRFGSIGQNLAILSAGGNDTIAFRSINSIAGITSIDTNSGNDTLNLDDNNDSVFTQFNGSANIQLGDGNDTINYGGVTNDLNDGASFQVGGVANGGPMVNDTSTNKNNSDNASPTDITEVNFEL